MPLTQIAPPYPIFTDKNGDPLDAGYLYFGTANLNPETSPIQVYYDSSLTQPAAQPIRTSNGYPMRNGSPALLYANSQFSVTVRDKNNALVIYSPVGYGIISGTPFFTDQMTYNQGGTGAVTRILTARLRDYVSIQDFGAVGDGVTDDSAAVQAAADYCVASGRALCAPAGYQVYLASAVDLRSIKYIDFAADILVNPAIVGVPVTIGGFAQQIGGRWVFNNVSDGSSVITGTPPLRPILRVFGSKAVQIELGSCQYFQIYSDAAVLSGNSNAYNNIYLHGAVYKMELFGAPGISWVNENFIYGGRIKKLIIDGTNYPHNHNKWYNPTMEGADVDVQFLGGASENYIYGARFEGATASAGVTFDAGTYNNVITQTWSGSGYSGAAFRVPLIPVSDSGQNNLVTFDHTVMYRREMLFSLSPESMIVGNATDSAALDYRVGRPLLDKASKALIVPGLRQLSTTSFRFLGLSDLVPVEVGDVFSFGADYDGSLARQVVYVFDADQKPITSEGGGGAYVNMPGVPTLTVSSGYGVYSPAANQSASDLNNVTTATIVRPEVKFVRIGIELGTAGSFRYLAAYRWSKPTGRQPSEMASLARDGMPMLNGAPTRGYVPLGFMLYNTATSAIARVSYAWETQVSGALSAGATSVTVVAPGAIADGDVVGVVLDDETTHWTSVSSLSSSTFTIAAIPAGRSVADGARIVFNRWV